MKRNTFIAILAIAVLASLLLVGRSSAERQSGHTWNPPNEVGYGQVAADVVDSTFSYQGFLEENGEPVTGDRNMVFSIYSDGACTTQVGGSINQTVSVNDGVFDVGLSFDAAHFDGQALWLQTEVEGTVIGCQPIQAAPYALSLRPGAVVNATTAAEEQLLHARSGTNTVDEGILGAKLAHRTSLGYPVGLYAYAYEYGSVGVWGVSDSQFGWGVNGVANGTDSIGVRGISNAFTSTTYGVYGEASSPDGYAGYFEHTASTGDGVGLYVDGPTGAVINGTDGSGLSVTASGSTGEDDAIRGDHSDGDGVVGFSDGPGGLDNGVIGFTNGGYGVYAFSNATGQYAGYFGDPIYVVGSCTGCNISYVAQNSSGSTLQSGDVVQADGMNALLEGASVPVLQVSAAQSSEQVLGVVVGKVEMTMVEAGTDDAQPGPHYGPVGGSAEPGDYVIVLVQGLAQVRIDPSSTVQSGDRVGLSLSGNAEAVDVSSFGMALDQPDASGLAWVLIGFD